MRVKEGAVSSGGGKKTDDDCTEARITKPCLRHVLDFRKSFLTKLRGKVASCHVYFQTLS